ncbi:hypothetical protein [Roseateles sp.]|uniref:hypothetical protein n=1 Tax=Roseateles sp. TaxID=1971397 RepID=UPI003266B64A
MPFFVPPFSHRLLLLPLALALAHCGGGGGSPETPPVTTPNVVTDPYAGTAYLKVQKTTHAIGGGPGMGRAVVQGLVDLCNEHRLGHYGLPPMQPDESLMAGIDVQFIERFYDNGKAAEKTTGYGLSLYDLQRWLDELKAGGGPVPKTPPDCSAVTKVELNSGTLWLDNVKYDLRFDTKQALGTRGAASFTPTAIDSDDKVAAWPKKTVLGESCSVASGPAIAANLVSCVWDRFPAKNWLNLPWALESTGGAAQEVRVIAVALESNKPLPAGAVDIPAGFTAKVN